MKKFFFSLIVFIILIVFLPMCVSAIPIAQDVWWEDEDSLRIDYLNDLSGELYFQAQFLLTGFDLPGGDAGAGGTGTLDWQPTGGVIGVGGEDWIYMGWAWTLESAGDLLEPGESFWLNVDFSSPPVITNARVDAYWHVQGGGIDLVTTSVPPPPTNPIPEPSTFMLMAILIPFLFLGVKLKS